MKISDWRCSRVPLMARCSHEPPEAIVDAWRARCGHIGARECIEIVSRKGGLCKRMSQRLPQIHCNTKRNRTHARGIRFLAQTGRRIVFEWPLMSAAVL